MKARAALLTTVFTLALGCSPKGPAAPRRFYYPPVAQPPAPSAPPAVTASAAPSSPAYKGLGVESISPEQLKKFAAPALPPGESRRIQSMLDLRAPGAGTVSPDGKRLFFGWSITGTPQIYRLDGAMSFPTQLTGGEDSTSLATVTPDGKWLVVQRDRNGEENPGLYLLRPDGGPLTPILHKAKVQAIFQEVSDDSKTVYFRANDVTPESYAIYAFDIASGKTTKIFGEPGIWSLTDLGPLDEKTKAPKRYLLEKAVGSNQSEFYELDAATNKLTPVIGKDEKEDYVAAYGDGGEILVLTPKLGEFRRLYKLDKGKLEPITPEQKADVSGFSVDRNKTRILYSVNQGGYSKVFGLDVKSKKPLKMPKLEGDQVSFGATSADGRFTSFMVDPGTRPPEAYVYEWKGGKLAKWHKAATPEVDTSTFAKTTLESYPARDGTAIPMFVRRPAGCDKRGPGQTPCPVVVAFHGGPEGQALPFFSTRAQMFVDEGFVYAEPNVRGSDGYGKSWIHADDGPKRLAVVTDIEDASKYIREKWAIDGKAPKVGVYGGSYGGYSVLAAMSMFAGAYDVGVSVVGISSLLTFLENTAPYRRILRISEYGDPEKDRAALTQLSPITHVDKVKAPLMILQGATDPRVPVGEALQFHEALVKKNVPTELIVFPDEGHGFQKRPNQVLAIGHTLRFFKQHLK